MNKSKQAGLVGKLMLFLIMGGVAYGAYFAKKSGMLSKQKVTSSYSTLKSSFAQSSYQGYEGNDEYTGYGIQLMATKQLDMAKELMNDFASDGYSAFVLSDQGKGRGYYKVRLGPYAHRSEAIAIKEKVVRRYPNSPYVKTSIVIYKPE